MRKSPRTPHSTEPSTRRTQVARHLAERRREVHVARASLYTRWV